MRAKCGGAIRTNRSALAFLLAIGAIGILLVPSAPPAWAGQGVPTLSPASGSVGSNFTAEETFTEAQLRTCSPDGSPHGRPPDAEESGFFVRWDNPPASTAIVNNGTNFSVTMAVPSGSALGAHTVSAFCRGKGDDGGVDRAVGTAVFTVVAPPTTTTTTAPTTTTTVARTTTTTTQATTTTTKPTTTTTNPPAPPTTSVPTTNAAPPATTSTTAAPTATTTTTAATTTTRPAPPTTEAPVPPTIPAPVATPASAALPSPAATTTTVTVAAQVQTPPPQGIELAAAAVAPPANLRAFLVLDHSIARPGEQVVATGQGCRPGETVHLSLQGIDLGTAIAGPDGHFIAGVTTPGLPPGRYQVEASCGVLLAATLDVFVATVANPETSTIAILIAFILAGLALMSRRAKRPGHG